MLKTVTILKKKGAKKEINVKENSFCNAGELKNPFKLF